MKLGVLTSLFGSLDYEEMLARVVEAGLEAVELGTGNYPGKAHCNPDELLNDREALKRYKKALKDRALMISALSCHGNPIHPQEEIAQAHHQVFEKTILLAEELEVGVVCLFSGCPGGSKFDKTPNWVVCAWPPDYAEILKWQWEEILVPYWEKTAAFAQKHGVTKLALEMHPGFMVYNPKTLLRLREAVGPQIGANFDPSHLFWQGVNPIKALKEIGREGALFHFHAKDTYIDQENMELNGVLDATPYQNLRDRSWTFRTVGYGHDQLTWRRIISTLRIVGYDYVLSIEHEDPLASIDEGLKKAVRFLKECILEEPPAGVWWT